MLAIRNALTRSLPVFALAPAISLGTAPDARAQVRPPTEPPADWGATAITYENVPYPYPVDYLDVKLFGKDLRVAYMDVAPLGEPNGRTVVLFHGMNFFAAYWGSTIDVLRREGFRAIAIDRLGYGRSSKPLIHYNLHIPAYNTKALLDELGIERAAIVGHSMGGMVAARFASTYPETTSHVVFINAIGLNDRRPGRAWTDPARIYSRVLDTDYEDVLSGHMRYYPNGWSPEYLEWVKHQYGLTLSAGWPRMARIRAGQYQILYEDPVVHEWQYIDSKALVIGGGADRLSDDFPAEARHMAERLQNAELVIFPGVGHAPQFETPERLYAELIRFLESDPNEPADQSWRETDVSSR